MFSLFKRKQHPKSKKTHRKRRKPQDMENYLKSKPTIPISATNAIKKNLNPVLYCPTPYQASPSRIPLFYHQRPSISAQQPPIGRALNQYVETGIAQLGYNFPELESKLSALTVSGDPKASKLIPILQALAPYACNPEIVAKKLAPMLLKPEIDKKLLRLIHYFLSRIPPESHPIVLAVLLQSLEKSFLPTKILSIKTSAFLSLDNPAFLDRLTSILHSSKASRNIKSTSKRSFLSSKKTLGHSHLEQSIFSAFKSVCPPEDYEKHIQLLCEGLQSESPIAQRHALSSWAYLISLPKGSRHAIHLIPILEKVVVSDPFGIVILSQLATDLCIVSPTHKNLCVSILLSNLTHNSHRVFQTSMIGLSKISWALIHSSIPWPTSPQQVEKELNSDISGSVFNFFLFRIIHLLNASNNIPVLWSCFSCISQVSKNFFCHLAKLRITHSQRSPNHSLKLPKYNPLLPYLWAPISSLSDGSPFLEINRISTLVWLSYTPSSSFVDNVVEQPSKISSNKQISVSEETLNSNLEDQFGSQSLITEISKVLDSLPHTYVSIQPLLDAICDRVSLDWTFCTSAFKIFSSLLLHSLIRFTPKMTYTFLHAISTPYYPVDTKLLIPQAIFLFIQNVTSRSPDISTSAQFSFVILDILEYLGSTEIFNDSLSMVHKTITLIQPLTLTSKYSLAAITALGRFAVRTPFPTVRNRMIFYLADQILPHLRKESEILVTIAFTRILSAVFDLEKYFQNNFAAFLPTETNEKTTKPPSPEFPPDDILFEFYSMYEHVIELIKTRMEISADHLPIGEKSQIFLAKGWEIAKQRRNKESSQKKKTINQSPLPSTDNSSSVISKPKSVFHLNPTKSNENTKPNSKSSQTNTTLPLPSSKKPPKTTKTSWSQTFGRTNLAKQRTTVPTESTTPSKDFTDPFPPSQPSELFPTSKTEPFESFSPSVPTSFNPMDAPSQDPFEIFETSQPTSQNPKPPKKPPSNPPPLPSRPSRTKF